MIVHSVRTVICFAVLLFLATPNDQCSVEAASLRSGTLLTSGSAASNVPESPADLEDEEEEELLDESTDGQAPSASLPAAGDFSKRPQLAMLTQQTQAHAASANIPAAPQMQAPPDAQSMIQTALQRSAALEAVMSRPAGENVMVSPGVSPQAVKTAPFSAAVAPTATTVTAAPQQKTPTKQAEGTGPTLPPDWPPVNDNYAKCDPGCLPGRGICHDKVCFCRHPFTGSTCQHKVGDLYRAPKMMVLGVGLLCVFLGATIAKCFMACFYGSDVEKQMRSFGQGNLRKETWAPQHNKT